MATTSRIKLDRDELIKATSKRTQEDLSCPVCGLVFKNVGARKMHLIKKHEVVQTEADALFRQKISAGCKNVDQSLECSDCTKIFKSMKLVVQHFQKVHGEKELKCDICWKRFALLRDLKYHGTKNKCPGVRPQVEVVVEGPPKKKRIRPPKATKTEVLEIDLTKPGMRSMETQTEMMTLGIMADACSQVCQFIPNHGIDQQQQTQFDEYYDYSYVNQNTQTYCQTNTVGTTTAMWNQAFEIVDNGTQTWFHPGYEFEQDQQPQMIDGFSMTDEGLLYSN